MSAHAGAFNGQEGNPTIHALMAVLSGSYVTCSDGVGSANHTLLSRLYRSDGLLLKPSRPVTAIDAQLFESVFPSSSSSGGGGGGNDEDDGSGGSGGGGGGGGTAVVAGAQGQLYATHTTINATTSSVGGGGSTEFRSWFVAGMAMAKTFLLLPEHISLTAAKDASSSEEEAAVPQWLTYRYDFGPVPTRAGAAGGVHLRTDQEQQQQQQQQQLSLRRQLDVQEFSAAKPLNFSASNVVPVRVVTARCFHMRICAAISLPRYAQDSMMTATDTVQSSHRIVRVCTYVADG